MGVKKGDKVGLFLPMVAELPLAMLACARYVPSLFPFLPPWSFHHKTNTSTDLSWIRPSLPTHLLALVLSIRSCSPASRKRPWPTACATQSARYVPGPPPSLLFFPAPLSLISQLHQSFLSSLPPSRLSSLATASFAGPSSFPSSKQSTTPSSSARYGGREGRRSIYYSDIMLKVILLPPLLSFAQTGKGPYNRIYLGLGAPGRRSCRRGAHAGS